MQFKLIIISEGLVHVTLDLPVTLCATLEVMTQETSIVKVERLSYDLKPKVQVELSTIMYDWKVLTAHNGASHDID